MSFHYHANMSSLHILDLHTYTRESLSREFAKVPHQTKALYLDSNDLNRLPPGQLSAIFALIPITINQLILNGTRLDQCRVSQLIVDLTAIPSHIKSLALAHNNLFNKSLKALREIFKALPQTIHTLDLSYNTEHVMTHEKMNKLISALAFINKNVIHLKLGGNYLGSNSVEDVMRLAAHIPPQVISLDLIDNDFFSVSTNNLWRIFSSFPAQVAELTLSASDFVGSRLSEDLVRLGQALSYVTKLHLVDAHHNPVSNIFNAAIMKSHIGSSIMHLFKDIQALSQLPRELRNLVLEYSEVKGVYNMKEFVGRQQDLYALNLSSRNNSLAMVVAGGTALVTAPLWWPCLPLATAIPIAVPVIPTLLGVGIYGLFASPVSALKKPESLEALRLVK